MNTSVYSPHTQFEQPVALTIQGKPRCRAQLRSAAGFTFFQCLSRGRVQRAHQGEQVWFCGTHDPVRRGERDAKRRKDDNARIAAMQKATANAEDRADRRVVLQFLKDLDEPRVDRLSLLSLAERWNRRDPYGRGTFGGDVDGDTDR